MRFSSKTFKKRSLKKRRSNKKRTMKKQKGGSVLYRGIPKEATFSDAPTDGLE
jgi:hypothetical protein